MKILIMGFSKIKYMPYLNFYLENIDSAKHEIHVLYWNRDMKEEKLDDIEHIKWHELKFYQLDNIKKYLKIRGFLSYRKYVLNLMKHNRFDFIIALHSLPAVMMTDVLVSNYSGRYIFDYRDITYERFRFYRRIIQWIVKKSKATFISSDGFRNIMPVSAKQKIYTTHNLSKELLKKSEYIEKDISEKIRISFWGFIREERLNREIIKKLSNDYRFELHYYGREQKIANNLKEYVKDIDSDNVFFHGEYAPEDIYYFMQKTDVLHNLYESENMMRAVSNKFYEGIDAHIPQMCMVNSEMAKKVKSYDIGIVCNPYNEDFVDNLFEQYMQIDRNVFRRNCENALWQVKKEYAEASSIIKKVFN